MKKRIMRNSVIPLTLDNIVNELKAHMGNDLNVVASIRVSYAMGIGM